MVIRKAYHTELMVILKYVPDVKYVW